MLGGSGRGGARGRGDGRVHSHGREPHVAAPLACARGRGAARAPAAARNSLKSFKVFLHGVVCGIARGRRGRRKRLRRRFGLVFGRGISASHSGDVALLPQTSHIVDALTREQRGSRSVSDALSRRSLPSCAIAGARSPNALSQGSPPQCPQRRKTRGARLRAASTACPQRRKTRARRRGPQ